MPTVGGYSRLRLSTATAIERKWVLIDGVVPAHGTAASEGRNERAWLAIGMAATTGRGTRDLWGGSVRTSRAAPLPVGLRLRAGRWTLTENQ